MSEQTKKRGKKSGSSNRTKRRQLPWFKRIFNRKSSSSSSSSQPSPTPSLTPFYKKVYKKVTRAIVNKFRPKPPAFVETAKWVQMLPVQDGTRSRYRLTSLISDAVFPGSAIIDGDKMTAHISLITKLYDESFDTVHFVQDGMIDGWISVKDMSMSPKSCCLTYTGERAQEVRTRVLEKLAALANNQHDKYSYSYKELCKIIIRMSCKETNPDKLRNFANEIKNQNEIICSGIFLHVYMDTFAEMELPLSDVFPLNPFACTPARILDVLKTNKHWDVVPLKLLLLVGPLTYPYSQVDMKEYNKYLSEVNCSLISENAIYEVKGVNVYHDKYLPGIYDNKAKQVLLEPLQIYAKK
jgi:hypothetical protein